MTAITKAKEQLERIEQEISEYEANLAALREEKQRLEKAISQAEAAGARLQSILEELAPDARSLFFQEIRQALPSEGDRDSSHFEEEEIRQGDAIEGDAFDEVGQEILAELEKTTESRKVLSLVRHCDFAPAERPTSRRFGFAYTADRDPDDIPF